MCGTAARVHRNVERRLRRSTKSQSAAVISQIRALRLPPTLLTRMSRRPQRVTAASTRRAAGSSSVTSPTTGTASPPAFAMRPTVPSSPPASMSPSATRAPSPASRSAIARPSPLAAPVTTATLSCTRPMARHYMRSDEKRWGSRAECSTLRGDMPRNIVLLSDGTGNSAAKLFKTNVWRLHGALDRSDPARQVAHYSDGIGTSSFKPLAILGGVFGFGLKRNVLDLYQFACRSYRPGDQIFGFGFSRGAFTIRIVAGLIAQQGLVTYRGDEAQLARDTLATYRVFRGRFNVTLGFVVTPFRRIRDRIAAGWRHLRGLPPFDPAALIPVDAIRFLGAWDTVSAYGGPIEEITRGIDYWLWPLSMPDRFMSAKVQRACHALALDDERNALLPVPWGGHG